MPYKRVFSGSIAVTGVPADCLPLKTPGSYGGPKLRLLLAAADKIAVNVVNDNVAAMAVLSMPPSEQVEVMATSESTSSTSDELVGSSHGQPETEPTVPPAQPHELVVNIAELMAEVVSADIDKSSNTVETTEDRTPCCVCARRHNEPPFMDWYRCLTCLGWHHKHCGVGKSKKSARCHTCFLANKGKKTKEKVVGCRSEVVSMISCP